MPELLTPARTALPAAATAADDSLGIDRAFVLQMARMPVLALGWVAAGAVAHQLWALASPAGTNFGPLVVICATGYPIERLHTVNLACLAAAIAAIALVAAPVYALVTGAGNPIPTSQAGGFHATPHLVDIDTAGLGAVRVRPGQVKVEIRGQSHP